MSSSFFTLQKESATHYAQLRSNEKSLDLTAAHRLGGGIFLCGFVIFGTVIWFDLAWALSKGRHKTLSNRANRLVEMLETSNRDTEAKFADFQDATPEGGLIQVFDSHGQRVLPPPNHWAATVPWPNENCNSR
jgi:hypothetical protein